MTLTQTWIIARAGKPSWALKFVLDLLYLLFKVFISFLEVVGRCWQLLVISVAALKWAPIRWCFFEFFSWQTELVLNLVKSVTLPLKHFFELGYVSLVGFSASARMGVRYWVCIAAWAQVQLNLFNLFFKTLVVFTFSLRRALRVSFNVLKLQTFHIMKLVLFIWRVFTVFFRFNCAFFCTKLERSFWYAIYHVVTTRIFHLVVCLHFAN